MIGAGWAPALDLEAVPCRACADDIRSRQETRAETKRNNPVVAAMSASTLLEPPSLETRPAGQTSLFCKVQVSEHWQVSTLTPSGSVVCLCFSFSPLSLFYRFTLPFSISLSLPSSQIPPFSSPALTLFDSFESLDLLLLCAIESKSVDAHDCHVTLTHIV